MTRFAAALRAIRGSRWADMRDVVEAQVALLRAQAMRRLRPVGALVDVSIPVVNDGERVSVEETKTCARLARAVDRAARYGVLRPQCLARAVALSRMLDARGIAAHRIRIGVRKERDFFTAHAWVELGDAVFGDTIGNTEGYVPLTDVSVNHGPGFSSRQARRSSSRLDAPIRQVGLDS